MTVYNASDLLSIADRVRDSIYKYGSKHQMWDVVFDIEQFVSGKEYALDIDTNVSLAKKFLGDQ